MSGKEGENVNKDHSKDPKFPSTDEVIDEVIEQCNNLKVEGGNVTVTEENGDDDEFEDSKENVDEDFIDEVYLKDLEVTYSAEDIERKKNEAAELKEKGNLDFKQKNYEEARIKYTAALRTCPIAFKEERAILYANRAACKMKQEFKGEAIEDCTKAIELNSTYLKALNRRAILYEADDKLDEALEDYKKILEIDSSNAEARAACMKLPSQINERNERLKTQMLGSLKELGNKLLRPFGLSTDNFQVQQDPNSGGYSINFNQTPK